MFGSAVLEAAIGLIFVFFILSLLASSAREILEGWLQSRAVHLERGIRELLRDESGEHLAKQIYDHPLISSLYAGEYNPAKQLAGRALGSKDPWKRLKFRSNLPAYIPARNFALALLDLSARGKAEDGGLNGPLSFERVRAGAIDHIPDVRVRRAVLMALDGAKGDLEQARANLEAWFDSGMDRVSGWYRKQTQWILLVMGLVAAVTLNIDTVNIARSLYADDDLRSLVVAQAEKAIERGRDAGTPPADDDAYRALLDCPADTPAEEQRCVQGRLEKLGLPLGWSGQGVAWPWQQGNDLGEWAGSFPWSSIPGWLLTALAVTLGAPFWFDLLNKMMVIRSTVKPHEKSPEESSEDRQRPAPRPVPTAASAAEPAPEVGTPFLRRELDDPGFQPNEWKDLADPQEGDL